MTELSESRRQTVDLSGYPDLVVVYLAMRVRKLPRPAATARTRPADPQVVACAARTACCCTRTVISSTHPAARRDAPVLARLRQPRALDAIEPHAVVVASVHATTPAGPASGTRRTSCAAASRRSTTTSRSRSGYAQFAPTDPPVGWRWSRQPLRHGRATIRRRCRRSVGEERVPPGRRAPEPRGRRRRGRHRSRRAGASGTRSSSARQARQPLVILGSARSTDLRQPAAPRPAHARRCPRAALEHRHEQMRPGVARHASMPSGSRCARSACGELSCRSRGSVRARRVRVAWRSPRRLRVRVEVAERTRDSCAGSQKRRGQLLRRDPIGVHRQHCHQAGSRHRSGSTVGAALARRQLARTRAGRQHRQVDVARPRRSALGLGAGNAVITSAADRVTHCCGSTQTPISSQIVAYRRWTARDRRADQAAENAVLPARSRRP